MHLHWLDCVALLAYLSTITVNGLRLVKRFYRHHR